MEFIIINILNNAKNTITVALDQDLDYIYLRFTDEVEGIARENLHKIFTHGFTTKSQGHGFGLHNAANFLSDMKGKIRAKSDGIGKGSTFVLGFQKR